ncbi:MAG TPA: undecaprenyl-phosphate glucose phosphotransferase, partial [Methylococcaceae bacterium]|nr:undecaprenyl-phosphate glucose phosphotransferase [Methylococcaceae bacterium]
EKTQSLGMILQGLYDDRGEERHAQLVYPILGNTDALVKNAQSGKIDLIYITLPMKAEERIKEVVNKLADTTVTVYLVPDLYTYQLFNGSWTNMAGHPIISVFESPFLGLNSYAKRAQDIVLSIIILTIVSPVMLVISAGIKLTSKGPVLFKQRRYGISGEEITVWKFRSMTTQDNGNNIKQATKDDARITPLGSFLRRTSLDELPQFFNVLMGDMSIVGPRPHAVAHNELYRNQIRGYMLRHAVKPGITGWAQVNG